MKAALFQHIKAQNDVNGNPRRCFVFYSAEGAILNVIDEGYGGHPRECDGVVQLPSINVSVSEYRAFLRVVCAS